jgi:hypothetical protein
MHFVHVWKSIAGLSFLEVSFEELYYHKYVRNAASKPCFFLPCLTVYVAKFQPGKSLPNWAQVLPVCFS